jgi:PAS domain S-box-containing protein
MDGIIIDCNKAYADTFGFTKKEIIGKSIFDFVPEDHKGLVTSSFTTWRNTGKVRNREIIFKKKDGSTFPALLSANNLYDETGKRIGSNSIIVDISSIRKAEQEIEDLKEKRLSTIGELTARIAHDMRNPLSVIKNTADIIKMENPEMYEKSIHNWNRLERGIDRIKHQVEDVLDYVKTTHFVKTSYSLDLILQDAIERVNIPLGFCIGIPKQDVKIFCDSEKIETVFVNLIMNAIQAIDNNPGRLDITIEENKKDFIKIKFEDSGPGIPSDLISKIFDPLFTTRQIGTGLGLPSCKNIIEQHGGSIEVFSPPGKGAMFEIVLPKY